MCRDCKQIFWAEVSHIGKAEHDIPRISKQSKDTWWARYKPQTWILLRQWSVINQQLLHLFGFELWKDSLYVLWMYVREQVLINFTLLYVEKRWIITRGDWSTCFAGKNVCFCHWFGERRDNQRRVTVAVTPQFTERNVFCCWLFCRLC